MREVTKAFREEIERVKSETAAQVSRVERELGARVSAGAAPCCARGERADRRTCLTRA